MQAAAAQQSSSILISLREWQTSQTSSEGAVEGGTTAIAREVATAVPQEVHSARLCVALCRLAVRAAVRARLGLRGVEAAVASHLQLPLLQLAALLGGGDDGRERPTDERDAIRYSHVCDVHRAVVRSHTLQLQQEGEREAKRRKDAGEERGMEREGSGTSGGARQQQQQHGGKLLSNKEGEGGRGGASSKAVLNVPLIATWVDMEAESEGIIMEAADVAASVSWLESQLATQGMIAGSAKRAAVQLDLARYHLARGDAPRSSALIQAMAQSGGGGEGGSNAAKVLDDYEEQVSEEEVKALMVKCEVKVDREAGEKAVVAGEPGGGEGEGTEGHGDGDGIVAAAGGAAGGAAGEEDGGSEAAAAAGEGEVSAMTSGGVRGHEEEKGEESRRTAPCHAEGRRGGEVRDRGNGVRLNVEISSRLYQLECGQRGVMDGGDGYSNALSGVGCPLRGGGGAPTIRFCRRCRSLLQTCW